MEDSITSNACANFNFSAVLYGPDGACGMDSTRHVTNPHVPKPSTIGNTSSRSNPSSNAGQQRAHAQVSSRSAGQRHQPHCIDRRERAHVVLDAFGLPTATAPVVAFLCVASQDQDHELWLPCRPCRPCQQHAARRPSHGTGTTHWRTSVSYLSARIGGVRHEVRRHATPSFCNSRSAWVANAADIYNWRLGRHGQCC